MDFLLSDFTVQLAERLHIIPFTNCDDRGRELPVRQLQVVYPDSRPSRHVLSTETENILEDYRNIGFYMILVVSNYSRDIRK